MCVCAVLGVVECKDWDTYEGSITTDVHVGSADICLTDTFFLQNTEEPLKCTKKYRRNPHLKTKNEQM